MSRSLHTNRDFEKLEPYEGKPSRTVLRGEEGSNALDLPDRPSDLEQRDGRGVRAGNEIAKHFAGNNVDVIIYAVEKSLDSYKFNLLHCKQTFISQLKSGAMGARTIDEGAMDEKSGMNFSEYMALLSGNTDLLDKAKLEKRIASLEGERKSFNKGRRDSEFKLESKTGELRNNTAFIEAMTEDWNRFLAVARTDKEGNRLNALKVDGVDSADEKVIGERLQEIAKNATTGGQYKPIGELYGFPIKVVSERMLKEGLEFTDNRFRFIRHFALVALTPPECSKFRFLGYGCISFQPLFQTLHIVLARYDCRVGVNGSKPTALVVLYPSFEGFHSPRFGIVKDAVQFRDWLAELDYQRLVACFVHRLSSFFRA